MRDRVHLRRDLPRSSRRLPLPELRPAAPEPTVAAEQIALDGTRSASFQLRTPAGTSMVDLPLPGLYNVYNALGAAALCLDLGVGLEHVVEGLAA